MLNFIGFFQLDNLIHNRVPFAFFNIGLNPLNWYTGLEKMHLNTYQIEINADQVLAEIESRKIPKDYAIVLMCSNGEVSSKIYQELTQKLYTNVYVVNGGYQQLVTERE